jgi:predicted ester cyclase
LDRNKAIVVRAWLAYDRGEEEAFAACITDGWVEHDASCASATLDQVRESMRLHRRAFPDKHTSLEQIVAEGDLVVTQTVTTATHRAEYLGVAPTGGSA